MAILYHVLSQLILAGIFVSDRAKHASFVLQVFFLDLWNGSYHHGQKYKRLNDFSKGLSKKPCHLAIVLGHHLINEHGAAQLLQIVNDLILWCLVTQIPFLTIYHDKNIWLTSLGSLEQSVKNYLAENLSLSSGLDFRISSSPACSAVLNVGSLKVFLMCNADNDRIFAKTVGLLSEKPDISDVETAQVESLFQNMYDAPFPELTILFTRQFKTHGFPPLLLRNTEIFFNPASRENVSASVFTKALRKFASTQQRALLVEL